MSFPEFSNIGSKIRKERRSRGLSQLDLSKQEMCNIAMKIGSDVPYFLEGGVKYIEGRGEIINKCKETDQVKSLLILLVMPNFAISTKWAYNKIKKYLEPIIKKPKFPTLNNIEELKLFENDFEGVVGLAYPEIMNIKKTMYQYGALYSGLSGSGSTMFGLYNSRKLLDKSIKKLSKYKSHIASPV